MTRMAHWPWPTRRRAASRNLWPRSPREIGRPMAAPASATAIRRSTRSPRTTSASFRWPGPSAPATCAARTIRLKPPMEVTPLKANHMVYLCSPHQVVFALDAATGQQKWKFDPHVKDNPDFQHLTCRGVSYHETKPGRDDRVRPAGARGLSAPHFPGHQYRADVRAECRYRRAMRELRRPRRRST